ncbi:MAG: PQQ-like beta-propeller repeat protein [Acidobacteria bacterium]|nr:PQQ-like beta-propeller repeat protein [Acidobacteriota bacterium]
MRRVFLAVVCLLVAGVGLISLNTGASAAPVADERYWPQWRGPNFDGVAPIGDPPIEWSETKNVAWKVEIPGSGYATPVIWEDRIFVLSAVPAAAGDISGAFDSAGVTSLEAEGAAGDDAPIDPGAPGQPTQPRGQRPRRGGRRQVEPLQAIDFTVMAINRADGSLIWSDVARHETPHEGKQVNNSWASSSAIIDGKQVFAFFGSRGLYAYDMDGNRQWDVDFGEMQIRGGFGEGSTPVLHGDTLVVVWDHQGDSFIAALDKNTGSELWRQPRDEPESWSTPLVVEVDGRAQVITAAQNHTYSYDLETGDLLWKGPGLTVNPIPSPVEADGIVYLISGYRGAALRAVRLVDAQGDIGDSPAILWEYNQDTPYVPSPLLYDGILYFLKSNSTLLTAFDVASGQAFYGPQRLDGVQEIYSSPVGAAGRVYLLGRDGSALVIENGRQFNVLATNSLDDGFEASPAIVGNELYLRGRRFLYRIEETGQP